MKSKIASIIEAMKIIPGISNVGMTIADEEGNFILYSDDLVNITGYSLKEAVGEEIFPRLLQMKKIEEGKSGDSAIYSIETKDREMKILSVEKSAFTVDSRIYRTAHYTDKTREFSLAGELKDRGLELQERLKELKCLYRISSLIFRKGLTPEEQLEQAVLVIPEAWQYPEITRASISIDDEEYLSADFRISPWCQEEEILINGVLRGHIRVYYLEEKPEFDEGPFLREERYLLVSIGNILSQIIYQNDEKKLLSDMEHLAKIGRFEIDLIGQTWSGSEGLYDMLELPHKTLYMERDQDMVHPEDIDLFRKSYSLSLEKGHSTIEHRIITPKGKTLFVKSSTKAIKDSSGNVYRLVGVVQDITESKEAEKSAGQQHSQLRMAMSFADMGSYSSNIKTGVNSWGPDVNRILGLPPEEKIRNFDEYSDYIAEEDREMFKEEFYRSIREKTDFSAEYRIKRSKGEIRWINNQGKLYLDEEGNPDFILGIVQDITARKKAEAEILKEKEKAEKANRIKTNFLASMSHELRTPLNAITGFATLLKKQLGNLDGRTAGEYLDQIRKSSSMLLEMVDDILDLTKLESGNIKVERNSINPERIIRDLAEIQNKRASEKNISIELDINENLGLFRGDEKLLRNIVHNLLSNAVQYTPANKSIGIRAYGYQKDMVLKIWDEGEGISDDLKEILYVPFEQGIESSRIHKKGIGLGLALVKKQVDLIKGSISLESDPGKGSVFTLVLPGRINEESNAGKEKNSEKKEIGKSPSHKKILIIEDNPANLQLLQILLKPYGPDIHIAKNGKEGIGEIERNIFDLIIFDIQLPDVSGLDILQFTQNSNNRKAAKLVITAFAMKGDRERYLEFGFDSYLSKPIDFDQFHKTVSELLNR